MVNWAATAYQEFYTESPDAAEARRYLGERKLIGPTLRRFAKLRLAAVALMIVGAGAKHFIFESFAKSPWIALRWLLIAILAFTVVYEITILQPAMERLRGDPAFQRLHKRSEGLMKASLVVAVLALFLS